MFIYHARGTLFSRLIDLSYPKILKLHVVLSEKSCMDLLYILSFENSEHAIEKYIYPLHFDFLALIYCRWVNLALLHNYETKTTFVYENLIRFYTRLPDFSTISTASSMAENNSIGGDSISSLSFSRLDGIVKEMSSRRIPISHESLLLLIE